MDKTKENIESEDNYVTCEYCGVFFHKDSIVDHCQKECDKNPNMIQVDINSFMDYEYLTYCELCKSKINSSEYESHIRECENFKCKICGKLFKLEAFQQHENSCINFNMNVIKQANQVELNLNTEDRIECVNCKVNISLVKMDAHEIRCESLLSHFNSLETYYMDIKEKYIINKNCIATDRTAFVNLDPMSEEYLSVSEVFFNNGLNESDVKDIFEITSIKSVINPQVLLNYENEKARISDRVLSLGLKLPVAEEWLFNSAYNYVHNADSEQICKFPNSFKVNDCKKLYAGKGLYFYENILPAVNYTNSKFDFHENNSAILSKVLVGVNKIIYESDNTIKINTTWQHGYDSIYTKIDTIPDTYVVYENIKVIPRYIINYYSKNTSNNDNLPQLYSLQIGSNNFEKYKPKKNKKKKSF